MSAPETSPIAVRSQEADALRKTIKQTNEQIVACIVQQRRRRTPVCPVCKVDALGPRCGTEDRRLVTALVAEGEAMRQALEDTRKAILRMHT